MTPATFADALEILSDISEQTATDFHALGMDAEQATMAILRRLPDPDAIAIRVDGKLLAILGWDKHGRDWYAWHIAKPDWFRMRPSVLKASRAAMRDVAWRHPGVALYSVPLYDSPAIAKWLTTIGFREEGSIEGMPVFRFRG